MAPVENSFGKDVRPAMTPAPADRLRAISIFNWRGGRRARAALDDKALISRFAAGEDSDDVSLSFLLRQSAAAVARMNAEIAARGGDIAAAVAAKASAEAGLAASAARLIIALFWVFVGVVLAREAGFGPTRGLDSASAADLARIFFAAGVVGAVAAFVGGSLIRGREVALSGSAAFGREAGATARSFGEAVGDLEGRLGASGSALDVSRMHCLALEAASFFERINFLSEPDHARAEAHFSRFLQTQAQPTGFGAAGAFALAAGLVVLAGLASGRGLGAGLPLWALIALPGLALLYVATGAIFAAASASAIGASAARARHETLHAMRTAYAETGAPPADTLMAAIERALSAPRLAASVAASAAGYSEAEPVAGSVWKTPAEGPRFVAQSFESAPPIFRPGRQEPTGKNFFGTRRR